MDESLKCLRTVYRSMILIAALLLVICTTTFQVRNYLQAVAELRTLKKLSWPDYVDFAIDALEQNLRERSINEIAADYTAAFQSKHQLSVVDSFSSTLLPLVPLPHLNSSVGEYRALLLAPAEIGYYKPAHATSIYNKVSADFAAASPDSQALSRHASIHSLSIELAAQAQTVEFSRSTAGLNAISKPLLPAQLEAIHRLHYTSPPGSEVKERNVMGQVQRAIISGPFIRHWLRSKNSPLLSPRVPTQPVYALPRSLPYSSLIDTLTPNEAIEWFKDGIANQQRRYGFLAEPAAAGIVGLIAPSLLLVLLSLLVSSQRHICMMLSTEHLAISRFPWIGLFRDRLSRLVFSFSLFLLPSTAAAACAVFLVEFNSGLFYFTAAVAIAILALSFMALRENRKLHRILAPDPSS